MTMSGRKNRMGTSADVPGHNEPTTLRSIRISKNPPEMPTGQPKTSGGVGPFRPPSVVDNKETCAVMLGVNFTVCELQANHY